MNDQYSQQITTAYPAHIKEVQRIMSSSHQGSATANNTTAGTITANGPSGVAAMAATASKMPLSVVNAAVAGASSSPATQQTNNFDPLNKSTSNTLKRNPKMELCKTDLLKLLGYLEGELQARDVVIAALKSEKMKHLLNSKYRHGTTDPHSALARDVAILGGANGSPGSQTDQLTSALETLIARQRQMKNHMARVLKNAEVRHHMVIKELEEEKQKNENTPTQGDDTTHDHEKEKMRLKKVLETEKQEKKRLEAEAKKISDTLEEEKTRHRQIVLILLAERKKIILKYIEERKRSEDLAQILSEEKVRADTMAEGLEEESKKALHMEAEMEKQQAHFDIERSQFRQSTANKDKKLMEQQAEIEKLRSELEVLKEQQARGGMRTIGVTPPPPPAKPANLAAMPTLRGASPQVKGAVLGAGTPMVSSKVVQPTATVSSVPVSGPTTGIARSVTPGQALRGAVFGSSVSSSLGDSAIVTPPTIESATAAQALQHKRPLVLPTPSIPSQQPPPAPATSTTTTAAVKLSARGVPPPVPPNKPIVPPKKEVTTAAAAAAFLRRSEQPSPNQSPVAKLQQQNSLGAVQPTVASVAPASPLQLLQSASSAAACNQPTDHEVKPR
ncbi:uncharacterized protein CG10915 [Copidosoma floridanum]|uniref:uncharacterized protein CG10915 n=1 Tax=Copidosoma floridanum TaxID=29053 RepID=UPI0006C98C84|nr:uncharacterized protein CG10915 [Copidosoma floridanum]